MYMYLNRSQDSSLVEHRTRDQNRQKVASSNPGTSSRRIFSSRVNFLCWLLFGIRCNPVLPQWHIKNSGHSAKSACGRLYLNMHTPWTQWRWSGLTMPLRRHSVGTYQKMSSHTTCQGTTYSRPQLSQLAEPLWTGPGLKSGISVCDLLPKKTKKSRQEMNCQTLSQDSRTQEESHHPHHTFQYLNRITQGRVWRNSNEQGWKGIVTISGIEGQS